MLLPLGESPKFDQAAFLAGYREIKQNNGIYDMSLSQKELYQYLKTLPKDVTIAAHPFLADSIPIFSKRKVFINFELSHTWYNNYWETVEKRTFDFFDAYYSEDLKFIYEFCKRNKIDYLVVDTNLFSKEYLNRKRFYFEPFNSYIINLIKNRKFFALANIPDSKKDFIKNNIFLVKTDRLIN